MSTKPVEFSTGFVFLSSTVYATAIIGFPPGIWGTWAPLGPTTTYALLVSITMASGPVNVCVDVVVVCEPVSVLVWLVVPPPVSVVVAAPPPVCVVVPAWLVVVAPPPPPLVATYAPAIMIMITITAMAIAAFWLIPSLFLAIGKTTSRLFLFKTF